MAFEGRFIIPEDSVVTGSYHRSMSEEELADQARFIEWLNSQPNDDCGRTTQVAEDNG